MKKSVNKAMTNDKWLSDSSRINGLVPNTHKCSVTSLNTNAHAHARAGEAPGWRTRSTIVVVYWIGGRWTRC